MKTLYPPDMELLSFQENLVKEYVNNTLDQRLALISPPGTGKSIVVVAIIYSLLKQEDGRYLIICPSALVGQWAEFFNRYNVGASLITKSSQVLAQLESNDIRVFIGSIDKLKNPIFCQILREKNWSLVCFDEAQNISIRSIRERLFLELLAVSSRVLLLSVFRDRIEEMTKRLELPFSIHEWDIQTFAGRIPEIITEAIEIPRNSQENDVWNASIEFIQSMPEKALLLRQTLFSRLFSSFYSFYRSLERRLAHLERSLTQLETMYVGMEMKNLTDIESVFDINDHESKIKRLLADIEFILEKNESKTQKIASVIQQQFESHKIIVISKFRDNIDYLQILLEEIGLESYKISGFQNVETRTRIVRSFEKEKKILFTTITTLSNLIGFQSAEPILLIWFDFPRNPETLEIGRKYISCALIKQIILIYPEQHNILKKFKRTVEQPE